jgi:Tfp pilus assembly protein PilN
MIRVNLLGPGRSRVTTARRRSPRTAWIGIASFAIATVASGIAWWSVRADAARLDHEIAVVQTELERLRATAREAAGVEARRKDLAGALTVLAAEDAARFAPVRRLAAIGQSVPRDVWLTVVRQRGSQIEVDGRAASLAAVTEFAERIQHAGVLTTPVDILSTSAEIREGSTLVRFSLRLD